MVNEASNGKGGGAQHQQLQQSQQLDPTMCLELALEGERLCKSGDFTAGVAFLEVSLFLLPGFFIYLFNLDDDNVSS